MENSSNSTEFSFDYQETICPVQCDALLSDNQSTIDEYIAFCLSRNILPAFDANKKQLRLFGNSKSILEAEKRFIELQNHLLIELVKQRESDGIRWWYEAWDGTWQQYNTKITAHIEQQYKAKVSNFLFTNELDELITIDFSKLEEIYGTRVKRICRSKIDEQQPCHWTITPLTIGRFLLDFQSDEYLWIKDDFDKTMARQYKKFVSVERIQNLRLFKQFCAHHDEFIAKYGETNNGTMRFLYHGCPEGASKKIVEKGFNRSYAGKHGCLYGKGVYFSTDASYANGYATPNEKNERRMFFSRVLVGRSTVGSSVMCEPEEGYDTTTNGTHMFVCYYDSQCYPEYLLTYV